MNGATSVSGSVAPGMSESVATGMIMSGPDFRVRDAATSESVFRVSVVEMPHLLSTLRENFPLAKSMWQVVRDTRDGLLEANLFTDGWPDFTTVVSQEFVPRLSEVADIRIYTRSKERVMPVINGAKLLQNTGKWQLILFFTGKEESEVSQYLLDGLRWHSYLKGLIFNSYKFILQHTPDYIKSFIPPSLPSGYMIKDLLPEHADLVAKKWTLRNWFAAIYPTHLKAKYLRELIIRYGAVGVYTADDPTQPIAWGFMKNGGTHGIYFVGEDYRSKQLFWIMSGELCSRILSKGVPLTGEGSLEPKPPMERIGFSHAVVLHQPTISCDPRSKL